MPSAIILGAGVIGLSIGWQLAREGWTISILEQRQAGRQASWAAAGMLAPYSESLAGHIQLLDIGVKSLSFYPRFLAELQEDSRTVFPRENDGTLYVAINRDDKEWLERNYRFMKRHNMPVQLLSAGEVRQKEPLISPKVTAGLWMPTEKQVNNHLLIEALIKAFKIKNGKLIEEVKALSIDESVNCSLQHIHSECGEKYTADSVVVACGAWTQQFHSNNSQTSKIYPQKGQLLNLKMSRELTLKSMIRSPHIYMAPKQDGIVRVGATNEDQGFNEEVTAGGVLELLQCATEVVPAISEYTIDHTAVGLRPMTSHQGPLIGATWRKGIYQAVGHGRSGILLAPYTAYFLKELLKKDFYECKT